MNEIQLNVGFYKISQENFKILVKLMKTKKLTFWVFSWVTCPIYSWLLFQLKSALIELESSPNWIREFSNST